MVFSSSGKKLWEKNLGGTVRSVAFSPDGSKIAVGIGWEGSNGYYGRVVVFSSSGEKLWESPNLGGTVLSVAFSPNGSEIVAGIMWLGLGGEGGEVVVFSPSGEKLWESPNLGGGVYSVAWSPNGSKIAAGWDFGKVVVFSSSGEKLWEKNLGGTVRSVAFSPDGSKIAAGTEWGWGSHGEVIVFSPSGEKLWESGDLGGGVYSVAWSPDGTKIAAGGSFDRVIVFSSSGEKLWESGDLGGRVYSIAFSPDGTKIAAGLSNGRVMVFSWVDFGVVRVPSVPFGCRVCFFDGSVTNCYALNTSGLEVYVDSGSYEVRYYLTSLPLGYVFVGDAIEYFKDEPIARSLNVKAGGNYSLNPPTLSDFLTKLGKLVVYGPAGSVVKVTWGSSGSASYTIPVSGVLELYAVPGTTYLIYASSPGGGPFIKAGSAYISKGGEVREVNITNALITTTTTVTTTSTMMQSPSSVTVTTTATVASTTARPTQTSTYPLTTSSTILSTRPVITSSHTAWGSRTTATVPGTPTSTASVASVTAQSESVRESATTTSVTGGSPPSTASFGLSPFILVAGVGGAAGAVGVVALLATRRRKGVTSREVVSGGYDVGGALAPSGSRSGGSGGGSAVGAGPAVSFGVIESVLGEVLGGLVGGYGCVEGYSPREVVLRSGIAPEGFEGSWECCLLGYGGWGCAYLCRQEGREAVFKVPRGFEGVFDGGFVPTVHARLLERIRDEARVLRGLKHPNILRLLGVGRAAPVLAYEFAEGGSLEWQLSRGWSPGLRDVLLVGIQVGDALRYIHSRGLIHGDIKPGNVFVKGGVVKVGDFSSMVKLVTMSSRLSRMSYTPGFRAPEQVFADLRRKVRELGLESRIDTYLLGNLLLYLLTGRSVDGEDAVGSDEVNKAVEAIEDPELREVVREALNPDPLQRPSTEEIVKKLLRLWSRNP